MIKLVVPVILVIFIFEGEATDLAGPPKNNYTIDRTCRMSPIGLINPHWTKHKKGYEGIECWHSGYRTLKTFPKKFNPVPVPKPNPLPMPDWLYQQYQFWYQLQQFFCLFGGPQCAIR